MQALCVSANRRYLQKADGTPFFYLADTAWELLHRLTRPEIDHFLTTRARQGFTAIQAVLLCEFEGLSVPNQYGRLPLTQNERGEYDPARPDTEGDSYWALADYAVVRASELGLYMALLPTWGDKFNKRWGAGPEVFTPENARIYGRFVGERFRDAGNIVWVLGGDRPIETDTHAEIVRAMAEGLHEGDGGRYLRTYHPMGGASPYPYLADEPWLDFLMMQTGHDLTLYDCYEAMRIEYERPVTRPVMDAEPRYEDHPACFDAALGYLWSQHDVRMAAWWDVLSGCMGHTYGNHCIWGFNRVPAPYFPYAWQEALLHPGAEQMRHVRALAEKLDILCMSPAQPLLVDEGDLLSHISAMARPGMLVAYSPLGLPIRVRLSLVGEGTLKIHWYDPRTGETTLEGVCPCRGEGTFVPPSRGKGRDWVLVLEQYKR